MIAWVDVRLKEWAAYEIRQLDRKDGYAGRSPLADIDKRHLRTVGPPSGYLPQNNHHLVVRAVVEQLEPARLKAAMLMVYVLGKSLREAARAIQVDEKTIRNWRDHTHDQVRRAVLTARATPAPPRGCQPAPPGVARG